MVAPLYDAHGHTIADPADGYMDNSTLEGHLNGILDIPRGERHQFISALQPHWNHIHFASGGDHMILAMKADGVTHVRGFVTIWNDAGNFL